MRSSRPLVLPDLFSGDADAHAPGKLWRRRFADVDPKRFRASISPFLRVAIASTCDGCEICEDPRVKNRRARRSVRGYLLPRLDIFVERVSRNAFIARDYIGR